MVDGMMRPEHDARQDDPPGQQSGESEGVARVKQYQKRPNVLRGLVSMTMKDCFRLRNWNRRTRK
jgi:hypothetical protein